MARASALSSMPVDLKLVSVPTLVILVCAAVASVPVMLPVTPRVPAIAILVSRLADVILVFAMLLS
jgi:hypothetical protein